MPTPRRSTTARKTVAVHPRGLLNLSNAFSFLNSHTSIVLYHRHMLGKCAMSGLALILPPIAARATRRLVHRDFGLCAQLLFS